MKSSVANPVEVDRLFDLVSSGGADDDIWLGAVRFSYTGGQKGSLPFPVCGLWEVR